MNNKSQVMMEFLMTYGWAILIVLAAIAALAWLGVLDFCNFTPEGCEPEQPINQPKLLAQVGNCTSMRSFDCVKQDAELVCVQSHNVTEDYVRNESVDWSQMDYFCAMEEAYLYSDILVPFDEAYLDMQGIYYEDGYAVYYHGELVIVFEGDITRCLNLLRDHTIGKEYAKSHGIRAGYYPEFRKTISYEVCDVYGIKAVK